MDIFACLEETGFDKHFTSEDTTITTLLLDENIITQLKNQNPKLLDYLDQHKHQFIWDMIQYTIVMPTEEDSYDRKHRLPYISSELLAIDSGLIYNEFFREAENEVENQYWKELLTFLDSEAASNEILMGYFQKVISNLYAGNKQRTTNVVANNLERFAKLLPNGSISDILKKCLVLLNENEGVVLIQRKEILNKVMSLLVNQNEEIKAVCADILNDVVNRFQAFSSGDVLVEELLASESFLKLYQCQNSEAVNNFLIVLVKKSQQRTINQNDESVPLLTIPNSHKAALDKYLLRESENIRKISLSTGFIVNQNKQTVRKSNKSMYSLLHLFGLVLPDGYCSFVNQGIIAFLWNLVVLYPYNNILHGFVRRIFLGILQIKQSDVRKCFLNNYEKSILTLAKQHLDLLRPFIYCIWMQAKNYPKVTEDPITLAQFQEFVTANLQPLLQYQVKHVEKQHNSNHKLVVDQEDAVPKDMAQMLAEDPKHVQEEKLANNQLSFEELQKQLSSSQKTEQKQKEAKKQQKQKSDFDFFGSFSSSSSKKSQQTKKEDKKDMFADFF